MFRKRKSKLLTWELFGKHVAINAYYRSPGTYKFLRKKNKSFNQVRQKYIGR